jgi:hypothetical protein
MSLRVCLTQREEKGSATDRERKKRAVILIISEPNICSNGALSSVWRNKQNNQTNLCEGSPVKQDLYLPTASSS